MTKENRLWLESEETAQKRVEQARSLKERAKAGGLRFEAYLPPGLAEWVLEMVEKGEFVDPSEAVFVFMQQARELDPHNDLKEELLRRKIEQAREGPYIDQNEVFNDLNERAKNRKEPAYWDKIVR